MSNISVGKCWDCPGPGQRIWMPHEMIRKFFYPHNLSIRGIDAVLGLSLTQKFTCFYTRTETWKGLKVTKARIKLDNLVDSFNTSMFFKQLKNSFLLNRKFSLGCSEWLSNVQSSIQSRHTKEARFFGYLT